MICIVRFVALLLLLTVSVGALPKIRKNLVDHIEQNGQANVMISFARDRGQELLSQHTKTRQFETASRTDRLTAMKDLLTTEASETQAHVVSTLRQFPSVSSHSLWMTNKLYLKNVDMSVLQVLSDIEEISEVALERIHNLNKFEVSTQMPRAEWGVDKIRAEAALELLRNSTNDIPEIRVGVIGTGARGTHDLIKSQFLGTYGWYDPSIGTTEPEDDIGVGTHEIGVIAGSDGIGVYPQAKWMACRACASFFCGDYSIARCGEVMTCPVLPNDTMPDCSKAPHVVHVDWWTGPGDNFYDRALEIWEAAAIIPIWPVGGQGPVCSTVVYPSESPKVIAVGGTTPEDASYERGSVGPTLRGLLKPEITAPSTNIVSAFNLDDSTLVPLSATSCASAHVAGVVAMLKAYDVNLTFSEVLIALARGTERDGLQADARVCGGRNSTTFPNNLFGFGRVDAFKSLQYVIENS